MAMAGACGTALARGVGAQAPQTHPCSLVVVAAAGTETGTGNAIETAIETGTGSGSGNGTPWSENGTAGQQRQGVVAAWSAPVQQQGQHEAAAGTGWGPTLQVAATVLTGWAGPLTTHTRPTCGAVVAVQHV